MTTKRNGLSVRVARGKKEAQGQRVQFSLAHHAERRAWHSVDRDVKRDLPLGSSFPSIQCVQVQRCSADGDAAMWPSPDRQSAQIARCGYRPRRLSASLSASLIRVMSSLPAWHRAPLRSTQRVMSRSAANDPRGVAVPLPPLSSRPRSRV